VLDYACSLKTFKPQNAESLLQFSVHPEHVGGHSRRVGEAKVHDELVFDLFKAEEKEVLLLVEERMKAAIALDVPIEVELGVGQNWLEAH